MSLNSDNGKSSGIDKEKIRRVAATAVVEYFSSPQIEAEEAIKKAVKKVEGESYARIKS